ncbi:GGDEF domain-containing response regulator [Alteromonas halophila]|uniref:diguanylate cyclase n=1 Tax=Alteromonas halophila TaxID=516698 RepID=A0A918N110_9ALTE|nr:diguanylate cyclase [Alteromonas halophila]GGW92236.1 diguanylate cyclase response regulator [Alteromonas halophila]
MSAENLQPRPFKQCHVLIVDDQDTSRLVTEEVLCNEVICSSLSTANNIVEECHKHRPDLILMDVDMPGVTGFDACKNLNDDEALRHIPVIFVTASVSDEDQCNCWACGCVDFIPKPINATTLWNRVRTHLSNVVKTELLEKLIYIDRLTGAYSRHYYEDHLPAVERHAKRTQSPVSFVLFDIDHFKQYNDHYGHQQGDKCLRDVALLAKGSLSRPLDKLIRLGGEEFLVVLPETDHEGAVHVADHLRQTIYEAAIPHKPVALQRVTVSAGVATMTSGSRMSSDSTIALADEQLYRAKDKGRNAVAAHRPDN